jgi:membrane protease YdiL (CAAX protease family)
MSELMDMTKSKVLAVVASVLLQSSYHIYQGVLNTMMLSVGFLMMSIYFAKTKRIAPVIIMHLILDAQVLFRPT